VHQRRSSALSAEGSTTPPIAASPTSALTPRKTMRRHSSAATGWRSTMPAAPCGSAWPARSGAFGISRAGTVTWQALAGWYVDAIVAGGLFDGRVSTAARGRTAGFNGTSVAASIEGGYPFPVGGGFAVEPQLQFVYQHLNFASRTDVDGIRVDLGGPTRASSAAVRA
jgi:Autotransporter beta-domain